MLRVRDDWDEWVTVDGEHFRNAGLWYHIDDPETSQMTCRLPLNLPAWILLLRNAERIHASGFESAGHGYLQLAFSAADFAGLGLGPVVARIWIDTRTLLIAKAVVTLRDGGKDARFEQMFTTYNDHVSIWAPAVNLGKDGVVVSNRVEILPKWGIRCPPFGTRSG